MKIKKHFLTLTLSTTIFTPLLMVSCQKNNKTQSDSSKKNNTKQVNQQHNSTNQINTQNSHSSNQTDSNSNQNNIESDNKITQKMIQNKTNNEPKQENDQNLGTDNNDNNTTLNTLKQKSIELIKEIKTIFSFKRWTQLIPNTTQLEQNILNTINKFNEQQLNEQIKLQQQLLTQINKAQQELNKAKGKDNVAIKEKLKLFLEYVSSSEFANLYLNSATFALNWEKLIFTEIYDTIDENTSKFISNEIENFHTLTKNKYRNENIQSLKQKYLDYLDILITQATNFIESGGISKEPSQLLNKIDEMDEQQLTAILDGYTNAFVGLIQLHE
ncbi:hypothetical protein EG856_01045 [Mycoplasmopsis phocirhinis]|uniref:Lipoprotein n=1 Tax=Mycoplasmopsis phocirhinis TaxID=142650 RepID=A0A4P6MLM3_9BACT|nr:hypothetical protein [Mycoplasmopsis phocirhinis]QBF34515.1 hypothetical protein EG856_01045 [Mycoplasmopsis phocirhinis]